MNDRYIDSSLLDRAIRFATEAHANSRRKGKQYPYIVHPLEAMTIVATITNDQELMAAAVLHDTVEDTDTTVEQLRELFGNRVAQLVKEESDDIEPGENKDATWHKRKSLALERLGKSSHDSKIVALGDKLSNMRTTARDYARMGDEVWNIFRVKERAAHEWYFRGLGEALSELSDTAAYQEFMRHVSEVFDH